jgi:hypothetical protein
MAKVKIPYYCVRVRRGGERKGYWVPTKAMIAKGASIISCGRRWTGGLGPSRQSLCRVESRQGEGLGDSPARFGKGRNNWRGVP